MLSKTKRRMPIYEFACPKCRKIFSFLSKRISPEGLPTCPKCGNCKMEKQMSRFAMTRGISEPAAQAGEGDDAAAEFNPDDPRLLRAMSEIERDMDQLDENNPKHLAHIMRKMKENLPPGTMPKEMETAIKRLEAGEDPEKIEADMGDLFEQLGEPDAGGGAAGGYSRDSGLYDY